MIQQLIKENARIIKYIFKNSIINYTHLKLYIKSEWGTRISAKWEVEKRRPKVYWKQNTYNLDESYVILVAKKNQHCKIDIDYLKKK